jgi:hypothetical protein
MMFLNTKQLKDRAFPDRITAKDGVRLREILAAGPHC